MEFILSVFISTILYRINLNNGSNIINEIICDQLLVSRKITNNKEKFSFKEKKNTGNLILLVINLLFLIYITNGKIQMASLLTMLLVVNTLSIIKFAGLMYKLSDSNNELKENLLDIYSLSFIQKSECMLILYENKMKIKDLRNFLILISMISILIIVLIVIL